MIPTYLSHGMGVNSTALMLYLEDHNINFESVFVDHGGDFPETYDYCSYLKEQGYKITVLKPNVQGHSSLYDYCLEKKLFPSLKFRWCTDKFKIRPQHKYFKKPCVNYIGFAFDESQRITNLINKKIDYKYPFIDNKITRSDCIDIIKEHGINVPPKSGCFFCPLTPKDKLRELFLKRPNIYAQIKELENNATRSGIFSQQKNLSDITLDKIPDLEDFI